MNADVLLIHGMCTDKKEDLQGANAALARALDMQPQPPEAYRSEPSERQAIQARACSSCTPSLLECGAPRRPRKDLHAEHRKRTEAGNRQTLP